MGWWENRRKPSQPWKKLPRSELRAVFVQLAGASDKFEGANDYERAIARINGAAASVIVAVIDRELSDIHLGEAFTAWAATQPLIERLSALQQSRLISATLPGAGS